MNEQHSIFLENNQLRAEIKFHGAELCSLEGKTNHRQYIWNANPTFWNRHAPHLFPVVGRLKDSYFEYDNKRYELNTHGFARDSLFTLLKSEADFALFSLKSSEKTKTLYPFEFEFQIQYRLEENRLDITYIVINKDKQEIYYNVGGHPAFHIDFSKKYQLVFNALDGFYPVRDLESMLLEDKQPVKTTSFDYNNALFEKDALIFGATTPQKEVALLEDGKPYITLNYNDFSFIGIWSPPGKNAPFVCLEPWTGISEFASQSDHQLKNKHFIKKLASEKREEFTYTLTFE